MIKVKKILILVVVSTLLLTYLFESNISMSALTSTLVPGRKGPEVERVQQALKNWGYYDGPIDGDYSWRTFQAVKNFQSNCGMTATGIAGQDTLLVMGLAKVVQGGVVYGEGNGVSSEQLLARAINGEARGEPYEGQVAVGAVILNRTRDPKFPKTIPGVIYEPGAFTAVTDGQINVPIEANSTVLKAARDALNGWDPTSGCIYYWNPATATSQWIWSRQIVKKIGKHYFGK